MKVGQSEKPLKKVVLGIDIGGTKVAIAAADLRGHVLVRSRFATQVEIGPQAIVEKIIRQVKDIVCELGAPPIAAVGVGCGGPLDPISGIILSPPNLPGWNQFPLADLLADAFAAPVYIDNDANVAALGEYRFGAGAGSDVFVYVTVSTGIGGGVVINGRLLHGVGAGAGEVGHQTIIPEGPKCTCGNRGCLEALASGTAIARRMRERMLQEGRRSLAGTSVVESITAEDVVQAARANDALALEVWHDTVEYLGIGLANVLTILAPQVLVVGGGVARAGDFLFVPLREVIRRHVFQVPVSNISIAPPELGDDVGVVGAITLAIQGIRKGRSRVAEQQLKAAATEGDGVEPSTGHTPRAM